MKVTKHRQKILDVLREWFRIHAAGPTLEELCQELGMQPRQKATVQRWLQTLRRIDVEWEDHSPRSLRLLRTEVEESPIQLSATETLRYLATGLVEWEALPLQMRSQLPEALRIGMSRMFLSSLIQGEEAPRNLREFFRWTEQTVCSWTPAQEIKNLSPDVMFVEDGEVSDFARFWQVTGFDSNKQVQESVLRDVLEHCRGQQLEESYRAFRQLIITKPVISYLELRPYLNSPLLRPLREFVRRTYVNLSDFAEDDVYHQCPRCKYIQRKRPDGTYTCRSATCERLCASLKLRPLPGIAKEAAIQQEGWRVVTPGVYLYGTLPGIWEVQLAEELSKLGIRVTLWPQIDEFDLLVELSRKARWAIDLKDWSYLDEEALRQIQYQPSATETLVVFPDYREEHLRIKVVREQLEPELGGIRLKLFSEVVENAKKVLRRKANARQNELA